MKPVTFDGGFYSVNGIIGRGEPPPIAGLSEGVAIIMGSGRNVWEDLKRFDPVKKQCEVIAVNNMALHWRGQVSHACSLHPEEPGLWLTLRKIYNCTPCKILTHCQMVTVNKGQTDFIWGIEKGGGGTSGLFGAILALALGYDKVVLAGIPLDDQGHFYDPPDKTSGGFKSSFIRNEWKKVKEIYFNDRIRSLSGWTREFLGEPDDAWLRD